MKQGTAKIYHWGLEKASSNKAPLWLALLFGLEIALFIPLDAVLIFFCLQKRSHIFLYVSIATIASTISGLAGYLLGHFLWDLIGGWVVPHLISASAFERVSGHMQQYEHWALFLGALIPFPLKVLSLASGVFQLGVIPFTSCFAIARLLRFSLIGGAMALWGESVKSFVDRHFHRIFMVIGAKVAVALFVFWILAR
ncbi:MAG: VTT domain-containing protein [Chlamydiales bacterium]